MNKFIPFKTPFFKAAFVLTAIFAFYAINYCISADCYKTYVTTLYARNFAEILNNLCGKTDILRFFENIKTSCYAPLYFINFLLPLNLF